MATDKEILEAAKLVRSLTDQQPAIDAEIEKYGKALAAAEESRRALNAQLMAAKAALMLACYGKR